MASAGADSGSYFLREDSSFLMDCFSLLAKALDSLHGVRPAMSAFAGEIGEERIMAESATAVEIVFRGDSEGGVAEQEMVDLTFLRVWSLGLMTGFGRVVVVKLDISGTLKVHPHFLSLERSLSSSFSGSVRE